METGINQLPGVNKASRGPPMSANRILMRVVSENALNRSATSKSSSSSGISVNKVAVDSRLQPQGQSIIWAQADITEAVGCTQSAVSHQLRTLKQARLVKAARDEV